PTVTAGGRGSAHEVRGARRSLRGRNPGLVLDLAYRALVRIEVGVVDLRPAAELGDGEQPGRRRELRLVGGEHGRVDRAVAPGGEDLLRGRRERVVDERLGRARRL